MAEPRSGVVTGESGATGSSAKVISSPLEAEPLPKCTPETHADAGDEERDHSSLEHGRDEPSIEPELGTGEDHRSGLYDVDDSLVDLDKSIERFHDQSKMLVRSSQSQYRYERVVRLFDEQVNLGQYSRRQMAGPKGRQLVKAFLNEVRPKSQAGALSALRCWARYGLGIVLPIDKSDTGLLPKPDRGMAPVNKVVEPWIEALEHEKDVYVRLLVRLELTYGWRPSHLSCMKWRNLVWNGDEPSHFYASGVTERFKRPSPILAIVTPDVGNDLLEWHRICPDTSPDKPLLPTKYVGGKIVIKQSLPGHLRDIWNRFGRKWTLPKLTMRSLRHWGSVQLRKGGLTGPPRMAWFGHDSRIRGDSSSDYDHEIPDDILEQQRLKVPGGPLAVYRQMHLGLVDATPKEAHQLCDAYIADKIGDMALLESLHRIRLKVAVEEVRSNGL